MKWVVAPWKIPLFIKLKSRHFCVTFSIIQQDLPVPPKSFCLLKCGDIKCEPPVAAVPQSQSYAADFFWANTAHAYREVQTSSSPTLHFRLASKCVTGWISRGFLSNFSPRELETSRCYSVFYFSTWEETQPCIACLSLISSTHQAFFNQHFN